MNDQTVSLEYANSLVYELEKAMWDERGRGGRYRMTTIGRDFFKDKALQKIQSPDPEAIVKAVDAVLREAGICAGIQYSLEDRLLRVMVQGCIHQPVELKMMAKGIEPFACLPANLIVLAIEEKLNKPVELAQIEVDGAGCHLLLVLFEKRPE
jgi:acetoacetate decarboxylase